LINLKIASATFGIGGAIAPIAPPLATRLPPMDPPLFQSFLQQLKAKNLLMIALLQTLH